MAVIPFLCGGCSLTEPRKIHIWKYLVKELCCACICKICCYCSLRHIQMFLLIVLIISGVEQNPGPGERKGSHQHFQPPNLSRLNSSNDNNTSSSTSSDDENVEPPSSDSAHLFTSLNARMNTNISYMQKKLTDLDRRIDELSWFCQELGFENEKLREQNEELTRKTVILEARIDSLQGISRKETNDIFLYDSATVFPNNLAYGSKEERVLKTELSTSIDDGLEVECAGKNIAVVNDQSDQSFTTEIPVDCDLLSAKAKLDVLKRKHKVSKSDKHSLRSEFSQKKVSAVTKNKSSSSLPLAIDLVIDDIQSSNVTKSNNFVKKDLHLDATKKSDDAYTTDQLGNASKCIAVDNTARSVQEPCDQEIYDSSEKDETRNESFIRSNDDNINSTTNKGKDINKDISAMTFKLDQSKCKPKLPLSLGNQNETETDRKREAGRRSYIEIGKETNDEHMHSTTNTETDMYEGMATKHYLSECEPKLPLSPDDQNKKETDTKKENDKKSSVQKTYKRFKKRFRSRSLPGNIHSTGCKVHRSNSLFSKWPSGLPKGLPKRTYSAVVSKFSSSSKVRNSKLESKFEDQETLLSDALPASSTEQSKLTEMFPEEAGSMDPRSRIIPFLPGKKFFGRSHIREVAVKRMAPIAEYCKSIVKLPRKISQSKEVLDFFDLEPDDIDPPKEKKKTEIKANKISAPKALEHYIAVSEYQKQEKGEITLKVGMLVEVLEKTETGWWFVTVEDEQGWVPSTCLEREDGVKEDTTKRFKPGEEEQYLCTEEFIPHGEDELGLERGAVVDVVEKNLEGWWIVRYNGKEGYVPATFLMKSEAFSMKKQKVKRASVGGPEIVRNLHDISDLLKEDTKEEPEQEEKCFTLHELSKILKEDKRGSEETEKVYECIESQKSRSLKRGGLTRPPPRLSVKPKRGEQFPVSQRLQVVHAESFLKEYITIADFSDAVGDGISFKAGEVVKVLEKRDGGWWYIEIGNKEGWAPATYIEESSQGPVQPPSFDHKESRITREQSEDFFTSDSESDESEEDTAPRSSSGFGGLANALKAKLTKTTSKPLPSTPNRKEAESIEKNEKSIADNKPVPPAPPLKNLADNRPVPPAPPVKNLADNRPAPPAPPVKNLADNRPVPPTPPLKNLADNRPAPPAPPAKHLNEKADTSQDDVQSAFPVHLRHVEKETTKQRAKNKPDQTQKVPLRMGAPPPPPPSKGSDTKEPASPPKQKKPALPIHSKQFEKKAQLEDDGRRPRSSVDEELSGTKGIAGALKAKFGSDAVRPTSVSDTNKTSNTTDIKKPKFGEIGIKPHLGPTKPWTAKAEPQTQSEKSRIVGHEALKKPETLQKPGAMKKPDFNIRDSHVSVPKSTEKEVISVGKVSDLASVLKSKLEGRQNVGDSQSHSQDNEKASHAVGHPNSPQKPANILQPNIGTKPPRPQTPPSPRLHQKPGHPGGYRKSANTENRDSTTHLNEGNAAKLSALFDGKDNKDLDPTKYSARPLPPKPDESASAVADDRDSRKSIVTNIPGKPAPTLAVKPKINFGHKQEVGQSGGLNSDLGGDRPPGVAGLASALKAKLEIKPGNVGAGDNRPDINTKPAILNKPITRIKPKPGGKNILQSGSENGIVNNAGQTEEVYCAVADFPGENEGEISLTIGIHVKLLEKAEPWWYVTYGSKEGWAPASYFEQVKPGDSSGITQSNPASNQTYLGKERPAQYKQALFRTLSDFTAENDGELSFAGGMEVTVLEKPEGGWWYVQIGRQEGWVPEAFLEEVVS